MDKISESWFHVSHTASFVFETERRTTITSIHAKLAYRTEDRSLLMDGTRCLLWSRCSSCEKALSGDNVYINQPFFVIAALNLNADGAATASPLGWEVHGGSTASFSLTLPSETPRLSVLGGANRPKGIKRNDVASSYSPLTAPSAAKGLSLEEKFSVTITLIGVLEAVDTSPLFDWRPLICYRWFELKPHVREVSFSVVGGKKWRHRQSEGKGKELMRCGEVKEAVAVSTCGHCILWKGCSFGDRGDVVPYYRVFTPARKEKCVRVRRFPHRNADIVGEIPFGDHVEAIGRETDPSTEETYVLVLLSDGGEASNLAETYGLPYLRMGKWLWGWSRIAGKNGSPLLEEVTNNIACGVCADVETFPDVTYFTSARGDRSVRIRSNPSLRADVVGHLEPNEVKAALAIHRIPFSLKGNTIPPAQQFVEWKDGGFSLLRNNDRVYLQMVNLQVHSRHVSVQDPLAPPPAPRVSSLPLLDNYQC